MGPAAAAAAVGLTPQQEEQQQLMAAMAMSQAHAQQQAHTAANNSNNTNEPIPQIHNPTPPPEEAIETLMAMGFDRENVTRVLQQCDNNVEVAANRLLGG
jgi:Holliday junction resolvasome RuvABC DNA-binding subunit